MLAVGLGLALGITQAWAQAETKAAPKATMKPVPAVQKAHRKASPEQIRKFNALQKEQSGKR